MGRRKYGVRIIESDGRAPRGRQIFERDQATHLDFYVLRTFYACDDIVKTRTTQGQRTNTRQDEFASRDLDTNKSTKVKRGRIGACGRPKTQETSSTTGKDIARSFPGIDRIGFIVAS